MSTIAAIATGPAAGGIGIIRLSGPASLTAARRVAKSLPAELTPRHAYFARFSDASGAVLDEGLVLYFQAPHSFTGEDVVELHAHGAPRLLSLLLAEVLREEGVRPATAGEFTRRAFLSGRLELSRAEAVADLVAAESEAQVRAAAAQLSGELTARIEAVHAPLLGLHADLEGSLDFPEEAEGADQDAGPRIDQALFAVRALLADAKRGALIRRGARVVLYGPVNAGKSTLFNALVGASRALVDAEPGTTRDTLEAKIELSGLAVTLIDTAGLRETAGRIEALGIGRTRDALKGADVAVLVLPPEASEAERAEWRAEAEEARLMEIRGKADIGLPLPATAGSAASQERGAGERSALAVSGQTGEGIDQLRDAIASRLGAGVASAALSSSERHLAALEQVEGALVRARAAHEVSTVEVVAGEVGLALEALAQITGEDASTALLDSIFARFCIGK
jgi:tRNA modification GTPase